MPKFCIFNYYFLPSKSSHEKQSLRSGGNKNCEIIKLSLMYWQSQWVTTMFLWLTNDRVSEKIFFYGEKKNCGFYLFIFECWILPNRQKNGQLGKWSTSIMEVIYGKKEEHLNEKGKHTKPGGAWNHPHPSWILMNAGPVKSKKHCVWHSCARYRFYHSEKDLQ